MGQPIQVEAVKRTVHVEVIELFIETGVPRDAGNCPPAKAIKHALRCKGIDARNVTVDEQYIKWSDPKLRVRYIYQTPQVVKECCRNVDADKLIKPFGFVMDRNNVMQVIQMGKRKRPAAARKQSTIKVGERVVIVGGKSPKRGALSHGGTLSLKRTAGKRYYDVSKALFAATQQ